MIAAFSMVISQCQSDFLNLVRWVAAWFVLAEHARSLVFADLSSTVVGSEWAPFYFVTGFGNQAVMVFFVVSGYLVGGRVLSSFGRGRFQWSRYLCDRLSRLYTVLIVALLTGLIFDTVGARYLNAFGQYTNETKVPIAVITRDFTESIQICDLVANLCFLQNVVSPSFGSNGPLWSLANEWWYYVLFPLALTFTVSTSHIKKWSSGLLLTGLLFLLPKRLLLMGLIWLTGAAFSTAHIPLLPRWISALLTAVTLTAARLDLISDPFIPQVLIGITFALLLNSMAGFSTQLPCREVSARLADFSYTLYLVHFPFLLFAASAIYCAFGVGLKMPPGPISLAIFALLYVSAIAFSWLLSLGTERNTSLVRMWGYRKLSIAAPRPDTFPVSLSVSADGGVPR